MNAPFKPDARTRVGTIHHINYTCGPEKYAQLQQIAKAHGVTLKELLRQMVEYALANMEKQP